MNYIQLHERAWGMESYTGRPKLDDILNARVVALWHSTRRKDPGYRITVHNNLDELNNHITNLVLHSKVAQPQRRLFRLFVDKELAKLKGVKVLWGRASDYQEQG